MMLNSQQPIRRAHTLSKPIRIKRKSLTLRKHISFQDFGNFSMHRKEAKHFAMNCDKKRSTTKFNENCTAEQTLFTFHAVLFLRVAIIYSVKRNIHP